MSTTKAVTAFSLVAVFLCSAVFPLDANAFDVARWTSGATGEWTSDTNNWQGATDAPLPSPGYPGTNHSVGISGGSVSVASQDVSVAELYMIGQAYLIVTNARTFSVAGCVNYREASQLAGTVNVPDGTVNLHNSQTGIVCALVFDVGSAATSGYLDMGSAWGATNGFPEDFGILDMVKIDVTKGGFRADANNITLRNHCFIETAGQEVAMRGDWLNPDGTTTFSVSGDGPGDIDIGGDWSFGGCTLDVTLDTNGVSLIQLGGDAILTNATIRIGSTDALTNAAATYDLVRVPTAKAISTNGLSLSADLPGGVACTASLDEDRGGYDYLVLTPQEFYPNVAITNPVADTIVPSGTNVTIDVVATDADGTISKVEFYANTNKLGEVTSTPYSMVWSNVLGGAYLLKAIATDNDDNAAESDTVFLGVQGATQDGRNTFITKDMILTFDDGCVEE